MSRSAPRPADSPPDRKSTLFCPSCDHANPVDGDWVVHERASSQEYHCPDCGTPITKRGSEHEDEHRTDHGDHGASDPAARLVRTWVRTATAWLRPWKRRRARV